MKNAIIIILLLSCFTLSLMLNLDITIFDAEMYLFKQIALLSVLVFYYLIVWFRPKHKFINAIKSKQFSLGIFYFIFTVIEIVSQSPFEEFTTTNFTIFALTLLMGLINFTYKNGIFEESEGEVSK